MALVPRIAAWFAVLAAVAVLVLFAMPSYRQGEASLAGKTAEDFALQLDGKSAHLSDLKGKVVVLNFYGTWCQPCIEETPSLNQLHNHIKSKNAVVLGIAADEDPLAYAKFQRDQNVVFPTFRDPQTKDERSPIALTYGTSMYPETYILDRRGKILRKLIGEQQWDSPDMLAYFDWVLGQS